MTEAWKSNPMHWCDYCKVWMQDNPTSRAVHEKGVKHQENVARKLRAMRDNMDKDKKNLEQAKNAMEAIERKAQQQYKKDLKAAEDMQKSQIGSWVKDTTTGYFYNDAVSFYYDSKTGMYYGGDPLAWTTQPGIIPEALYENATKAEVTDATAGPSSRAGEAPVNKQPVIVKKGEGVSKRAAADIGGHRMPEVGKIGGAKGVGIASKQQQGAMPAVKRKREDDPKRTGLSKEEADAVAKREAARLRVQQRTLQTFGMTL